MKRKKWFLYLLAACLLAGALSGCSGKQSTKAPTIRPTEKATEKATEKPTQKPTEKATEKPTEKPTQKPTEKATEKPTEKATEKPTEAPTEKPTKASDEVKIEGAKYVMIYNPYIYDDRDKNGNNNRTSLSTGFMGDQIVTGQHRAEGLEDDLPNPGTISQYDFEQLFEAPEINEGGRAGGLDPVYSKKDKHVFKVFDDMNLSKLPRGKYEFTCLYAGEHCYVWDADGSVTQDQAKTLGTEFDKKVFQADEEMFGSGRFTENGGKVNILIRPMQENICGYYIDLDIYATGEVEPFYELMCGYNYDHAIININSIWVNYDIDYTLSTLAHEYQHQIVATDWVEYHPKGQKLRSWLNEAMSAFAEDMVYPGIKTDNGYSMYMFLSSKFTKGQSLYNFDITNDDWIGAYGAVWLFAQYLSEKAGDQVFANVHEAFRTSKSQSPSEAEVLYKAVSETYRNEIDRKYSYPSFIENEIKDKNELWMSKMTLDFQLNSLTVDIGDSKKYRDTAEEEWYATHLMMQYAEMGAQTIEGGGRMIVALENGTFTIPKDAEKGLIYIGLDENFEPVTGLFTAAGEN